MTKYIIELEDDIKYLIINGKADNRCYTLVRPVDELEVLNSDYINEHYGQLQDEAYQRGLEDGKWKAEDGCDGCKYYEDTSLTNPCSECSRGCIDHYKPATHSDRIEVGDEVRNKVNGLTYVVTLASECGYVLLGSDGNCATSCVTNSFEKTDKHYDIQSILEAMRK